MRNRAKESGASVRNRAAPMCASVRNRARTAITTGLVLVCCRTAGTSAQSHLAGTALPTPVHGHTGSSGPTAPCVLRCTISTSCAVPHCLVLCTALHCVCPAALHLWAVGSGQWAVGSGQWAVQLLQCSATLPGGSGQWNSCNALPHCPWAVGSGAPAVHRHTAWGQWALKLLQCTATLAVRQCIARVPLFRQQPLPGQDSPSPQLMGPRIAGIPLPTAPRRCGSALQELHRPLPPGSVAVHNRSSTAHCPQAVRQCIVGVALPTAPRQCGTA